MPDRAAAPISQVVSPCSEFRSSEFQVPSYRIPSSELLNSVVQVPSYPNPEFRVTMFRVAEFRVTMLRIRVTEFRVTEFRVTKFRVPSSKFRVPSSEVRVPSCRWWIVVTNTKEVLYRDIPSHISPPPLYLNQAWRRGARSADIKEFYYNLRIQSQIRL